MKSIDEIIGFLKANKACKPSLAWLSTYEEPLRALEECDDISWIEWLAEKISPAALAQAKQAYEDIRDQASQACSAAKDQAWRAYLAIRDQAKQSYEAAKDQAWQAYLAIRDQAWKAYLVAKDQAWKDYLDTLKAIIREWILEEDFRE